MEMQDLNSLTFDERLGLMVDREMLDRENRRLATRLRKAKLRGGGLHGGHRLQA
jgi:hypothetical protein